MTYKFVTNFEIINPMETIKIPTGNLYTVCYKNSLIIKIPIDHTNNYRVSHGFYLYSCPHCNSDHYLLKEIVTTGMNEIQLLFSSQLIILENTVSKLEKENLYLRQQMEQMDKRLTTMEYHPPVTGGSEFHNLINEAKEAGDFS